MTFHLFIVALAGAGAAVIAMVSYPMLCGPIPVSIANTFWLLLSIGINRFLYCHSMLLLKCTYVTQKYILSFFQFLI